MAKLGDAIRRSQRIESTPMGFGAARPAAKPSMLVGFLGAASNVEAAAKAGADCIVADGRQGSLDAAKARSGAGEAVLGVWSRPSDAAAVKALREAGAAFLVFDTNAPAAAMLDEDMGYVLVLPAGADENFLRSLDALTLEALLLENVSSPLTVAGQIELGRVATLARKPLLCIVDAAASKEDLQCLRAAGVVGVLVSGAADGVSRLKETVASLPARRQRREDRTVVSLPRGQAAVEEEDDDDDDDDPA